MSKKPNTDLIMNTTLGIEIEMTGITRRRAAEVCASVMGEGSIVRDTHIEDGYHAWSCFDPQGRQWKFVSDSSICATGPDMQTELNTPPITYGADMDKLQALVRELRAAGAVSGARYGCGIHIHVSGKEHTPQTVINFANLFYSNDSLIRKSLGVAETRQRWCAPITSDLVKQFVEKRDTLEHEHKRLTFENLADVWYELYSSRYEGRHDHYNSSRYHILNLHRFFSTLGKPSNTIEVRAFNASLHAGEVRAYALLVLSMNASALTQKYIRALKNPVMQAGNEKYAMRTWLNRMGWTGEMFKNPHKLFIERLDGDCANRFGRYNDQYGASNNNDNDPNPRF